MSGVDLTPALDSLKRYWGYDAFRPGQDEVVKAVLEGKEVLVLFPTGGGKSLCFQVPATVLPGLTLVISPLVALMQDQVDAPVYQLEGGILKYFELAGGAHYRGGCFVFDERRGVGPDLRPSTVVSG